MKQYKNYILLIAIMLGSVSCEDYLDKKPNQGGVPEEVVFNDFQSVRGYLDRGTFLNLDDYLWYDSQGVHGSYKSGDMSDEVANPYKLNANTNQIMATILNKGLWLGSDGSPEVGWNDGSMYTNQGNVIPKCFYGIRICNHVLDKVNEMTKLTQDQINQLTGQAYFFRGWFYFEVIRRVGGFIPLDHFFNSDDESSMERLTYSESNDYIIKDMDEAIKLLPDKWEDVQTGRPTKSSAYAVKEMAELYAASPLMRNGIDRTDQYTDYDPERVKLAAEYARDCLVYINGNTGVYDQTMMSGSQYANIFYYPNGTYTSKEMLWYKNNAGVGRVAGSVGREEDLTVLWQNIFMSNRPGNMGTPNCSASQNIINKFETINGYSCQLTATGWQCDDPDFNPNIPFQNRDPRLYYFIILPGERFGTLQSNANNDPDEDKNAYYLTTWVGGRDNSITGNLQGGDGNILTKYMIKKYQWPSSVTGQQGGQNKGYADYFYNAIFIRTTQVWLDYAEAMNEAYGPDAKPAGYDWTAIEALNMVRERVGMCDVRSVYTASKEAFRDKIRDERAIELFCENHRWFDIRRWMIAEQLFANPNPIYGVTVQIKDGYASLDPNALPPGATVADRANAKYGQCFTYSLNNVGQEIRVFERKHYWYPMRMDEINRYPVFKQNPGW